MVIGQRRRIGDVRSVERRVNDRKVAGNLWIPKPAVRRYVLGINFLRLFSVRASSPLAVVAQPDEILAKRT